MYPSGHPNAPYTPPPQGSRGPSVLVWILLALGVSVLVGGGLALRSCAHWFSRAEASGVRLSNEVPPSAIDYMNAHKVLEPGESIVAYYDSTMSMDATEGALLTTTRLVTYTGSRVTAMQIRDIAEVNYRQEGLMGDIIEVESDTGTRMKIEIAAANQGESFKDALVSRWNRLRPDANTPVRNSGP